MVDRGVGETSEANQGKKAHVQPSFEVGDKAVYPAHGVGEITGIESRAIGAHTKNFYVLKILDSGMKIMVPTDNAVQVGLRQVISEKEAFEVYDILRAPEVAVDTQPWNRRYREYMEMLKSGSPYEVAKVLRDLYRLKFDKDLSFGERRLLDTARSLLVRELALAKSCEESSIEDDIQQIFDA
jgi:CarD family transcriptional regulator